MQTDPIFSSTDFNLYKTFKTSEKNEKEGINLQIAPGVFFKVTRIGKNKKYQEYFAYLVRPYKRMIDSNSLPNELARELLIKAFVEACLLDWQGVSDPSGKPLEFSKENAYALFKDLPDLFDLLNAEASNASNFKDEEIESIVKK
jgi:hypothetical protein